MRPFTRLAHRITALAGSVHSMVGLVVLLAAWLIWGAIAQWSRAWELAVALGAPIVALFMLIVLQHAQNREAQALQLKLNELILALREPDARVVDAERKSDDELQDLAEEYRARGELASAEPAGDTGR
jgi:low affinity Fe/Cu permease